jgi:hypothetical protein
LPTGQGTPATFQNALSGEEIPGVKLKLCPLCRQSKRFPGTLVADDEALEADIRGMFNKQKGW